MMVSLQKKVMFSLAGLLSFSCVLIVAAAMGSSNWVKATVLCKTGAQLVNATESELEKFISSVSYGLFHGQRLKQCGLGGRSFSFSCEYGRLPALHHSQHFTADEKYDTCHIYIILYYMNGELLIFN